MPPREPKRKSYVWRPFNPVYGPWYILKMANGKPISGAECVVQPDMDRQSWFWYLRLGKREAPRLRIGGRERSLEEAKATARAAFDEHF